MRFWHALLAAALAACPDPPPSLSFTAIFAQPVEVLMIQWMHQLSKSWVASLLMGGLALSFMVWGIADVFTGQGSSALATVGSTEISSQNFSRTYRNFL